MTDRILGPDEQTRDGDRMVVTLTQTDDYWRVEDMWAFATSSLMQERLRKLPSTVVTRPTPPERKWLSGDRVEDGNGRLWHREQSTYSPSGTDVWTDRRCTWRAAFGIPRPLTYLVPAPDGGA